MCATIIVIKNYHGFVADQECVHVNGDCAKLWPVFFVYVAIQTFTHGPILTTAGLSTILDCIYDHVVTFSDHVSSANWLHVVNLFAILVCCTFLFPLNFIAPAWSTMEKKVPPMKFAAGNLFVIFFWNWQLAVNVCSVNNISIVIMWICCIALVFIYYLYAPPQHRGNCRNVENEISTPFLWIFVFASQIMLMNEYILIRQNKNTYRPYEFSWKLKRP